MPAGLRHLSVKQRVFLSLVARYQKQGASELLNYLPSADSQLLKENLDLYLAAGPDRWRADSPMLRAGEEEAEEAKACVLYSADPGWVSEALKAEGAAVVGSLLPKFPKNIVGAILKDLPKETRRTLQDIKFRKISPAIRHLLRVQVERRFPRLDLSSLKSDEALKKIVELSGGNLLILLNELGLSEMTRAFSHVQRSTLRVILNRLSTKDAKELQARLKDSSQYTKAVQKEAQMHILGLDLDKMDSEQLVLEIGMGVFSRAFGPEDREVAEYFIYRLPPKSGQLLRRYLEDSTAEDHPEKIRNTRGRILDAYISLKKEFS
jgi:hypothetical protein